MNFNTVIESGKAHPMIVVGGGVALFLLIQMRSGTSSAAGATVDPNAQLSADTQIQMANIAQSGQLQASAIEYNKTVAGLQEQRDVALASIAAGREASSQSFAVQMESLAANVKTAFAGIAGQVHIADLNAQTQQLSIADALQAQEDQILSQTQIMTEASHANVAMAQLSAQTQQFITATYGDVQKYVANISGQVTIAQTVAQRDIAITQSNNAVAVASLNNATSQQGSTNSLIGQLGGALIRSFF